MQDVQWVDWLLTLGHWSTELEWRLRWVLFHIVLDPFTVLQTSVCTSNQGCQRLKDASHYCNSCCGILKTLCIVITAHLSLSMNACVFFFLLLLLRFLLHCLSHFFFFFLILICHCATISLFPLSSFTVCPAKQNSAPSSHLFIQIIDYLSSVFMIVKFNSAVEPA